VVDALAGVGGIEGEIGGAGLEDGEQRDDEFGGALEADADEGVWGEAERPQQMGEAVGARVEFAVGERDALQWSAMRSGKRSACSVEEAVDAGEFGH
ncbi:hypothetical protein SZ30_12740, partial [Burkholderia pseudomallei]